MSVDTRLTIEVDTEYETAVVWAKSAAEEYRRMAFHVQALRGAYGSEHRWYVEAAHSFARISESIVGWGNVIVTRDGDLSLFCRTRGNNPFVFGLIFHSIHNRCQVDGCPMYLNGKTGRTYHYGLSAEVKVQLHRHQWLYPADAPIPGTWSFHS